MHSSPVSLPRPPPQIKSQMIYSSSTEKCHLSNCVIKLVTILQLIYNNFWASLNHRAWKGWKEEKNVLLVEGNNALRVAHREAGVAVGVLVVVEDGQL
jgi:hypothetical protein